MRKHICTREDMYAWKEEQSNRASAHSSWLRRCATHVGVIVGAATLALGQDLLSLGYDDLQPVTHNRDDDLAGDLGRKGDGEMVDAGVRRREMRRVGGTDLHDDDGRGRGGHQQGVDEDLVLYHDVWIQRHLSLRRRVARRPAVRRACRGWRESIPEGEHIRTDGQRRVVALVRVNVYGQEIAPVVVRRRHGVAVPFRARRNASCSNRPDVVALAVVVPREDLPRQWRVEKKDGRRQIPRLDRVVSGRPAAIDRTRDRRLSRASSCPTEVGWCRTKATRPS